MRPDEGEHPPDHPAAVLLVPAVLLVVLMPARLAGVPVLAMIGWLFITGSS